MLKPKEIRDWSGAEIEKKLRGAREELMQLRVRKQSGQTERPHLFKELRRDIARMETILKEKRAAPA